MKKLKRWLAVCAVLLLTAVPCVSFAAAVPQAVLDARDSVAKVIVDYGEDLVGQGSGFAVGGDDNVYYIVTNHHVIADEPQEITVVTAGGLRTKATIAADLPSADLAVLELENPIRGMQPLPLYGGVLEDNAGQVVYALGFPGAAEVLFDEAANEQVTMTSGIVSAVKTTSLLSENGRQVQTYQIDVPLSGGNSGGPLLNEAGEVIGINTFGLGAEGKLLLEAENINGAVASSELEGFLRQRQIPYTTQTGRGNVNWPLVIGLAAAAVAVAVLVVFLRNRRKKEAKEMAGKTGLVKLEEYLSGQGGRIGLEMAAYLFAPVAYDLAQGHVQWRNDLNLSPDRVLVDAQASRAYLQPGAQAQGTDTVLTHPGYSAPEMYRSDLPKGAYTDVYGLGALMYRAVAGAAPLEALGRMGGDGAAQAAMDGMAGPEGMKEGLRKALSLAPDARFQSVGEMMGAMGMAYTPDAAYQAAQAGAGAAAGGKRSKKKLLWIIPVAALPSSRWWRAWCWATTARRSRWRANCWGNSGTRRRWGNMKARCLSLRPKRTVISWPRAARR